MPKALAQPQTYHKSEVFTIKKGSINGNTPYQRALALTALVMAVSLVLGFGSYQGWIFNVPDRLLSGWEIIAWVSSSLLLPYVLIFIFSMVGCIYILSQREWRYTLWILREGIGAAAAYITLSIMIGTMLVGVAFGSYVPGSDGAAKYIDQAATQTWYVGLSMCSFYAWMGYRSGWKIYRVLGAQTMQQRYEASVAQMERRVSGRTWEKYVEPLFFWVTGMDGHKPRGLWLFVPLALLLSTFGIAYGLSSGKTFFYPICVVVVPCALVYFFAAFSKKKDGRFKRTKPPFLKANRDWDTPDTYDPTSKGMRVFSS